MARGKVAAYMTNRLPARVCLCRKQFAKLLYYFLTVKFFEP